MLAQQEAVLALEVAEVALAEVECRAPACPRAQRACHPMCRDPAFQTPGHRPRSFRVHRRRISPTVLRSAVCRPARCDRARHVQAIPGRSYLTTQIARRSSHRASSNPPFALAISPVRVQILTARISIALTSIARTTICRTSAIVLAAVIDPTLETVRISEIAQASRTVLVFPPSRGDPAWAISLIVLGLVTVRFARIARSLVVVTGTS